MILSGYLTDSFNDSFNMLDLDGPAMRYPLGNEDKMKYDVSKVSVGTLNFIVGWAVVTPMFGVLNLYYGAVGIVAAVVSLPFLLLAKIFDSIDWVLSGFDDSKNYNMLSKPVSKFTQHSLGFAAGSLACTVYCILNFVSLSQLNNRMYSE